MQCHKQHEVEAEDVTVTEGELCLPSTPHVCERSSSSLSKPQQQPPAPVAALWDSDAAPKRHSSGSLCRCKVETKRSLKPKQALRRDDLKSSNGLATLEYYVQNFRYLSKLNRASPDDDIVVDDSILESLPSRSKARPHFIGSSFPRQYKKSCSDPNLPSSQCPPTPVSSTTTATTTSSRSSASKSSHLQNGSSKGMKRYPPPPSRQRSSNAQTRQVAVGAHAASASSSSSGSVKDETKADQLRELCIDIIQTRPQGNDNGIRDLATQCHQQLAKDIDARKNSTNEIPRHINRRSHPSRSRFAEIKDEWPASRCNVKVKDTATAQLRDLCVDIQTRQKRGNRDLSVKSQWQRKKDIDARKKSINEIPQPRRHSRFAEIKDEWPEDVRLRSCDDLVSCVTLPSTIQHK